jgi:hypothetical protein
VKLDVVVVHDGLCASFLLAKLKQVAKPIQPHDPPPSECPKSCTEKLLDSHCAKAARRTATTQRDPIIGECGLVPSKQCVVADKADLATGTVFEGVFSLCTRLSADRLWPVIQRRRIVATKADWIRSLTIAERDEPGPGGDFVFNPGHTRWVGRKIVVPGAGSWGRGQRPHDGVVVTVRFLFFKGGSACHR